MVDHAAVDLLELFAQPLARGLARARIVDRREAFADVGLQAPDAIDLEQVVLAPLPRRGRGVGRVEAVDDLLELDLVRLELVGEVEDRAHGHRRADHRNDALALAGLDALGDLDLALAGEQRDLAHLAQVDADRIVRAGVVVDVAIRARRVLALRLGGAGRHDRDALLAEDRAHLFDAALAEVHAPERALDLVGGQEALALALFEQPGEQRARELALLSADRTRNGVLLTCVRLGCAVVDATGLVAGRGVVLLASFASSSFFRAI